MSGEERECGGDPDPTARAGFKVKSGGRDALRCARAESEGDATQREKKREREEKAVMNVFFLNEKDKSYLFINV